MICIDNFLFLFLLCFSSIIRILCQRIFVDKKPKCKKPNRKQYELWPSWATKNKHKIMKKKSIKWSQWKLENIMIQQQTNTNSISNNQLNDDFTRIICFVYMNCMNFMRRTSSILTPFFRHTNEQWKETKYQFNTIDLTWYSTIL